MKPSFLLSVTGLGGMAYCLPTNPGIPPDPVTNPPDPATTPPAGGYRPFVWFNPADPTAGQKTTATAGAIDDAFELAMYAQVLSDLTPDIITKYFPEDWVPQVLDIFKQIVPVQTAPAAGGPVMGRFWIVDVDVNKGKTGKEDICAFEDPDGNAGEAYTINKEESPNGNAFSFSQTYICPNTFNELFGKDGPAPRRNDLVCEDFRFVVDDTGTQRYRMTNEMQYIGVVLLHEMMHNNLVAVTAFPDPIPGRAPLDSLIQDVSYGPLTTRKLLNDDPEATKLNADSYTWCAVELFWTMACSNQLAEQNGRFDDAIRD